VKREEEHERPEDQGADEHGAVVFPAEEQRRDARRRGEE
jgi:hypothetical protein